MTSDTIFLLLVLAGAAVLYYTQWIRSDLTALLVLLSLVVPWKPSEGVLSAVLTPEATEEAFKNYRQATDGDRQEPLVLIPLLVLDFLCIHPFSDGNGRIARLLTLLLLYHHGYQVGRFISLERLFEDSRESYYETLEASSQGWHEATHDVNPWMDYFWGVLIRAYGEFEDRVAGP